ncbi:MAG: hypothetical protein M0P69_13225 [Bacteroidales bacterium]|jgi:hypothetical protein|nr:hypothetical protein [Bacteroidales bacterium]MDD2571125.1 hypothetical protein [Bacteroidales bacterium]MDD2813706.1 hypothetical protein [Bacteroidales bacterium]MDD3384204.1 hypothetical protein [Bacteroidales bacterium]MDD3871973.1 hypothetical protein [Bacteroidales bacterium]
MPRLLITILLSILLTRPAHPQARVGEWQDQLSFGRAISLVEVQGTIYCGTRSGLFYYNPETSEIRKWTKVSGLSDVDIAGLAYSEDHKTLIIAYANSNIDLLRQNTIINIPDIRRKQITGSKRINSIQITGDEAILSCGFGIIRLNLIRQEVASTYYIGPGGSHIEVFETVLFNYDSLFAATEKGVYKAYINHPELENFRSWELVAGQPYNSSPVNHLAYHDGLLWAAFPSSTGGPDSIYTYNGYRWTWYPWYFKDIRFLHFSGEYLISVSQQQINLFNLNGTRYRQINRYIQDYINPSQLMLDKNGGVWIADRDLGLIYTADYENYTQIRPPGPWDHKTFDLVLAGDDLWIASGGYDASWNNIWNISGVSARIDGIWQSFNPLNTPEMGPVRDIIRLAVDPRDPGHLYGATWGYGVVEFKDGQYVGIHDDTNTDGAITSVFPGSPYIRIGGLAFDSKNNLWVTNSSVPTPISVRKTDGTWQSFPYGQYLGDAFTGQMVITNGDLKWVQLPKGNGLFVFDNGKDLDDTSDDRAAKVSVRVAYPSPKIMNNIYSLAVDLDNRLWVGTSSGAVVYYNPSLVFSNYDFIATQPSVDQGDNQYHALLSTETITAIAVDGANRKWFGTRNSGVFLTNPEGTSLIQSFNVQNSPLLSNEIISIAIDHRTGEVFFGTEAGVISYRGTATREDLFTDETYAFPNPVRPGYDGPITVRGLPAGAMVKITDLAGNLVSEMESTGGQAIWNGKHQSGASVASGVYLVLASTPMGTKKQVTKILIIR